ncbi:hypothetical protein TAMA11512_24090 [Selenomonas sp. TAMA-11512]|nr:hypothetical protein TAMA11512_24090 [Selenomonas sp. TAMA-11512]
MKSFTDICRKVISANEYLYTREEDADGTTDCQRYNVFGTGVREIRD